MGTRRSAGKLLKEIQKLIRINSIGKTRNNMKRCAGWSHRGDDHVVSHHGDKSKQVS